MLLQPDPLRWRLCFPPAAAHQVIALISLPSNMRRFLTPRRLAWCLTVHKVQGASIDFLEVDLDGCFEFGQAYVALSRARSAVGLSVRNFDERFIKTHEGAKRFHEVRFVLSVKLSVFYAAFKTRIILKSHLSSRARDICSFLCLPGCDCWGQ